MAVLFRDRLALAKTQLLEAACEDKERMSSIQVRPLQGLLRGFIDSLNAEARVKLSQEIMAVAFAPNDLDLLLGTLFPAPGPDNKKKNGNRAWTMADYRRFVAFFFMWQWKDLLDVDISMDAKLQIILCHPSWLSETI